MKAKYFTKLRKELKHYEVEHTDSLFGSFTWSDRKSMIVLARSHRHACSRAKRRGYGLEYRISDTEETSNWARWKVKILGTSNNFKNIKYY